jgi:hypothetical protein
MGFSGAARRRAQPNEEQWHCLYQKSSMILTGWFMPSASKPLESTQNENKIRVTATITV